MANENAVRNLIRIDDKTNPTLFRALQLMVDDLYKINNEVFPVKPVSKGSQGGIGTALGVVENFTGIAYPDNLRLDWDFLPGAFRYQIKMGNDWDTAKPVVITGADVANEDPIFLNLIYGTYNFLIRPMDLNSILGDEAVATLIIPVIGPPDLALEVVISTVMLRWTVPPSAWRIDHYIIYKDGINIGTVAGTFKLLQEQSGGQYTYEVAAVDIVGNIGTKSGAKIANLHDPSEFEFVDARTAKYNGTYVNTDDVVISGTTGVIAPVQIHTWQEHFEVNGFSSPQDQVDKGYPLYYQPSFIGDGTYEEVFDFNSIYKNLTIIADYNKLQLSGTTNLYVTMSYSEDNVTWSDPVIANSVLGISFRYVKVKWTFTNLDDLAACFISNLRVVINVTLVLDSGSANCFAADSNGTLITYNKTYTGINSVTATSAVSIQPLYVVCDSITKDNFRALVYDSSGNRHDANVNWKARGVV